MIVVLTPPGALPGTTEYTTEARIIEGLFSRGLERLHVRKPGFSSAELQQYVSSAIHSSYRDRVVLHGPHQLAHQLQLKVQPLPCLLHPPRDRP